jgi:OOP family OmpA-OmpF porin
MLRPAVAIRTAAAVLAAAGPVSAQGLSLALESTPPSDRALTVQDAEVSGDRRWHAALLLDYARESLVIVTPSQATDRVITSELWAQASLALALRHRYLLGAVLPGALGRAGDSPPPDGTLARPSGGVESGDVRLFARARVLGPADDGLRLSVAASVWAPTGTRDAYSSDHQFRAGASLLIGGTQSGFAWSFESGGRSRRELLLAGAVPLRVGSVVFAAAAARYALDPGARVFAGAELGAEGTVTNGAKLLDPRSTRGLGLASLGWRIAGSPALVTLALGPGIGIAPGTGEWRALGRFAWSPEADPPPPDQDGDGVEDASDACVDLPGNPSSDPLMHGCPELPPDADLDSIPDPFDACPTVAGIPTGVRSTHGCPRPKDRDHDGIADPADACPDLAGVPSADARRHGCPPEPTPPPKAALAERQIVISQQVQFETGTATLRPESDSVLEEVAALLRAHPEITRLEVQGHTDDTGSAELNRRLGTDRAAAVVAWLVAHGIESRRLVPRGHAAGRPIAENTTEEGRAKNRRVEFHLLEPEGGSGR